MGSQCCSYEENEKGNFSLLTKSISLGRLASDVNLNKQGLQADILGAVELAEKRNGNLPVNIVQIWRSCKLNNSLHSVKFKIALLELFKSGEILSDGSLCYFTSNFDLLKSPINQESNYEIC